MTASDTLAVAGAVQEGCTVITAVGDLDLAACDQLKTALIPALGYARPLVADLSGVQFVDSSGLSMLVRAHKAATARDIPMVIVPSPAVSRVLEISEIDQVVTVRRTLADALTEAHQRTT